jgi:hypothetical protein
LDERQRDARLDRKDLPTVRRDFPVSERWVLV